MLRKIRKLIFHPNRYFYDYFRKKLGFRKYFVTDKIKLLDSSNHQKWHKALFSHPYLYLYYKFNKRLRNPAYPILVDYRIENIEKSGMGGGKRLVIAVELERQNTIYFANPETVQKALDKKDPYLAGTLLKINFIGYGNKVLIDDTVDFGHSFKINFIGDNNMATFGPGSRMVGGLIDFNGSSNSINLGHGCIIQPNVQLLFKGNYNTLDLQNNCRMISGFKVTYEKDGNYLYAGPNSRFLSTSSLKFNSFNGLIFLCGNQSINNIDGQVQNGNILFIGERTSNTGEVHFWVFGAKNLLIGANVLLSRFIYFRTYDGHLIYDKETKKRINQPKSIIVGDHVWIGQSTTLLKGSHIEDGSVIGSNSIVTRHIPKNCIAAGSPSRVIKNEIIWDGVCDGGFSNAEQLEYESYKEPDLVYKPIGYENLLKIDMINPDIVAKEKVKLIQQIINDG